MDFEQRDDVDAGGVRPDGERQDGGADRRVRASWARCSRGGADAVARFGEFGRSVGLAFQHVDDLLGIWGDPAETGKPVYSDLQNRKKSLPVVTALSSGTAAGAELADLYAGTDPFADAELARAAELVDEAGGRQWSQAQASALVAKGLRELAAVNPVPRPAAELASLARLITTRTH